MLLQPGVLSFAWGSVVRQLAAGLGIELDEVTETYVREPAPEDFDIASGHIAKGTAAALRFEVRGMKDGKVRRRARTRHPAARRPAPGLAAARAGGRLVPHRDHRRTVIRGRPVPEQPQRRPQPRRPGRHGGPRRQRDPRRRGRGTGHRDDPGLAPHHWERAVRCSTRPGTPRRGLPMQKNLRYFAPIIAAAASTRSASPPHPWQAPRQTPRCPSASAPAARPSKVRRPPNARRPATSRSTRPRWNRRTRIRGTTSSTARRSSWVAAIGVTTVPAGGGGHGGR